MAVDQEVLAQDQHQDNLVLMDQIQFFQLLHLLAVAVVEQVLLDLVVHLVEMVDQVVVVEMKTVLEDQVDQEIHLL